MIRVLKLELKKSLKNKLFFFVIIVGFLITVLSFLYNLEVHTKDLNSMLEYEDKTSILSNHLIGLSTLFNHWIGGESYTLGSTIYFYIFPIMVAIPYGWSYCTELKSGYIKNMVIRTGNFNYYLGKYVATFISGGLAMIIPLVLNIMLVASFIPALKPDPAYMPFYGVFPFSFMSQLFYTKPILYVLIYIFIDFIFCGLIACISYAIANLIKNNIVVILFPFASILGVHYLSSFFLEKVKFELSPLTILHPPTTYAVSGYIIMIEIALLFSLTFLTTVIRGLKHEVY
jgi:hypothetical protein